MTAADTAAVAPDLARGGRRRPPAGFLSATETAMIALGPPHAKSEAARAKATVRLLLCVRRKNNYLANKATKPETTMCGSGFIFYDDWDLPL
ncbi:hypothetical protein D3C73_1516920 [compost metagenome]